MKSLLTAIPFFAALLFLGCPARSIHPLFTENESVSVPGLTGTWNSDDDSYTFDQAAGNRYRLLLRSRDENDSIVYSVSSGKLGAFWFLDSSPIKSSNDHHYLSVHVITRLELRGDTLRLASFEADWLKKQIETKLISIPHIVRDSEVILTATTEELQQLITAIGGNDDAFPNPSIYIRSH
ncbi:MAG: hypothetical protein WCW35_04110 [Bacteroidota bacterium]